MKNMIYSLVILVLSCNEHGSHQQAATDSTTTQNRADTTMVKQPVEEIKKDTIPPPPQPEKMYSNARFRDVRVKRTGENQFEVSGKAQVFEANVSWVIEDGHEELKKGFVTTDAGAPAWGNFSFSVNVEKKRPNSTLTLILFESSAMDGSRQHELPVALY